MKMILFLQYLVFFAWLSLAIGFIFGWIDSSINILTGLFVLASMVKSKAVYIQNLEEVIKEKENKIIDNK